MESLKRRQENPKTIIELQDALDENALTIGFARRFATYKRAQLIFRNLEKLAKIVNDAARPVQFIFAGKAHPADTEGQQLIKYITEVSKKKEFLGKIIFLENYDMDIASRLVQGVDIWLNTPTRPMEASGTSGQKAALNGVPHLSVLDGWWYEGYNGVNGWAIQNDIAADSPDRDKADAEELYNLLEEKIIPLFYDRDISGIPHGWMEIIKETIRSNVPLFSARRMVKEYTEQMYLTAINSS